MKNKEKFLALVSKEKTNTLEINSERIKNRAMLRESQQIALKVLNKLSLLGWSQKDLAGKLDVKPQQVSKIVSGKENLTIETQIKLQNVLDIPILASYYENKQTNLKLLEKKPKAISSKVTGRTNSPILH
jgi:plasmid maintenance system antidote protein VapI